jgi:hypothetical protein
VNKKPLAALMRAAAQRERQRSNDAVLRRLRPQHPQAPTTNDLSALLRASAKASTRR